MNLKRGSRSQRVLQIDGWDPVREQWVLDIARGSMRSNDFYPTNTDYSVKKRSLACSDLDQLDPQYSIIRIEDLVYLSVSELKNSWKEGAYQYVYQIRRTDHVADIYHHVTTPMASGMPGEPVRTFKVQTPVDIYGIGSEGSSEFDATAYARVNVYLPNNISVNTDDEIEIDGEVYDILTLQTFVRVVIARALRRGSLEDTP